MAATPTNTHPPHEGRKPETTGDNGRQDHFRAQDGGHTNQHPPPTWREKTRDNGRQWETRPLQSPKSRPHHPTPTPHMKGENPRQRETTGDKTTWEPKKPTTPTNTRPPHEGRQPETMGDNGRQDHFRAQEADHTNQHPTPKWRETDWSLWFWSLNVSVLDAATPTNTRPPHEGRQLETTGDKTTSEPKKPTTPTNTHPPHEGRQPETTGDKTTSEPKKPTTPTNTKAARSKVALRTPTVNCLGKNEIHEKNVEIMEKTWNSWKTTSNSWKETYNSWEKRDFCSGLESPCVHECVRNTWNAWKKRE